MEKSGQPKVGEAVVYVDEVAQEHDALVTNEFGGPDRTVAQSVNLIYVNPDEGLFDQYGRQVLRKSSVVYQSLQGAHGNYWRWPE